jgi:hypothetical protein
VAQELYDGQGKKIIGASLLMTTGRLSRVNVISSSGRSKSATELPEKKLSVS